MCSVFFHFLAETKFGTILLGCIFYSICNKTPFFCLPPVLKSCLDDVTKELCLLRFEDWEIDCIQQSQAARKSSCEDFELK